ncbi:MAG: SxtJ family membrane protein [Rhodospirillales bacterium]|nr:SxtJ family membrane protein [Rhodospirillales bacterium]
MAHRQSDRAFGFTFAVVFTIITVVSWGVFETRQIWTVVAACLFLGIALSAPWILLPLNRLWEAFASRLGRFNNFLLLSLFFFLFIFPTGLIIRLLGHDFMCRKLDPSADTYWTPVTRKTNGDTLQDMF